MGIKQEAWKHQEHGQRRTKMCHRSHSGCPKEGRNQRRQRPLHCGKH